MEQEGASASVRPFRCPKGENHLESNGTSSSSTGPRNHSYQAEAFNHSAQVDGESFWNQESTSIGTLTSGLPYASSVRSEPFAHGTLSQYELLRLLGSTQWQTGTGTHNPWDYGRDAAVQTYGEPAVTPSVATLGSLFNAYQSLDRPDVIRYSQASSSAVFLAPEEEEHSYLGEMRRPLQDYSTGPVTEDPWNSLRNRPTSISDLVLNDDHPRCYGYDPIATPDDWSANVPPLPEISTPASSYPISSLGGVSLFEEPPVAQLQAAGSISVGIQINWDSKTGQPLGNVRAKRRPSVEERASSQEVRRRGGSCASCRASHRKVIFWTASLLSSVLIQNHSVFYFTSYSWI
jgi:hypothetical protein